MEQIFESPHQALGSSVDHTDKQKTDWKPFFGVFHVEFPKRDHPDFLC